MNTPEQQLSESLLAACKAAGIEKPKYIAQDKNGTVWHFVLKPDMSKFYQTWLWAEGDDGAVNINHPPYAADWKESLLEWVEPQGEPLADVLAQHPEHVADTSKKVDDACKIAYYKHIINGNGLCWNRNGDYRQGWQDALAWKGGGDD
jgi:hypothetical protein